MLLICPIALLACATANPRSQELEELMSQVRALRVENARLEARLDRLETAGPLGAPSSKHVSSSSSTPSQTSSPAMPQLTVVKLKPKHEPAPRIATQVAVVEPTVETFEAIKTTPIAERADKTDKSAAAGDGPEPQDGNTLFDQGVEALKTGNVEGGIEQLQRFAADQPKHPKADNAIYWTGLGMMGMNDLEGASKAFEVVLQKYPAGDAVQDSMLKLAECRTRLKQKGEAKAMYQKILSDYPGSPAANQAQAALAAMK
ncbi:MAG: tol-pal system protein YbgF [Myxococcaceae bacterium]